MYTCSVDIGDATAGIVIVVLAFIIPAEPRFWCLRRGPDDDRPSPGLLDWTYTQKNFQWNVLLLLGNAAHLDYVVSSSW